MEQPISFRTVIQRTSFAEVKIHGNSQGKIEKGLVILFGVGFSSEILPAIIEQIYTQDEKFICKQILPKIEKLAEKIVALRIFSDEQDKMNLSVKDVCGGIYVVSQFTLFGNCKKGNRPSFTSALKPSLAKLIYEEFVAAIKQKAENLNVYSGIFGEDMQVTLCNDGPVTVILET